MSASKMRINFEIMKYVLWVLPSLIFVLSIKVINFNLEPFVAYKEVRLKMEYQENKDEFYNLSLEDILAKFPSEEEKLKWCSRSYSCGVLAEMGYHEARGEPDIGLVSVMQVAKNRADSNHPIFIKQTNIPSVVYKKSQFSYVDDGSRARGMKNKKQKNRAMVYAYEVLRGVIKDTTNGSLYYHANYVKPHFAEVYAYTLTANNHIFYTH